MENQPDDTGRRQIEKFKEAARQIGTDDSEEAFDDKLRRIAKSPPKDEQPGGKKPARK